MRVACYSKARVPLRRVRDGKWPRVTEIMPLEEGFEPLTAKSELLEFDANEMDREVYLTLHRDIRAWVSKRVRHA